MNVAMLLSCDSFELFYERVLGLDVDRFLTSYRNDWSWDYARGLLANGVRPTLYLPSIHHDGLHETETGVSIRFLKLARWFGPLDRFRRACRATRWTLYAQERVNAAAFRGPLEAAIEADRVDLLYVQEYWSGRFDSLASRLSLPITAVDQGGLSGGVVKTFKRSALARAAAIYCQTRDECAIVAAHGGHAVLQPNGCDTTFFKPPTPDRAAARSKTILTVARLTDKQKRTSDLIRALALLDASWRLDVIGDGPDHAMLAALAASLGVADRVAFHGFKTRAEVRDALYRCGVYAMPSSNEGVCLALLEAMACGASVVGTRIRTFETMIDDRVNGRLVPVADPAALAAAIDDCWARRAAFGPAATRTIAERFDSAMLLRRLATSLSAAAGRAAPADPTADSLALSVG